MNPVGKRSILIVEDERIVAKDLQSTLAELLDAMQGLLAAEVTP